MVLFKEINFLFILLTGGSFTVWIKVPTEVRFLPSHENRKIVTLSSLMFAFKCMTPSYRMGKRLSKVLKSQTVKGKMYNCMVSKVK